MKRRRWPYELIFALVVILALTAGYVYLAQDGVPAPGGLIGHTLGLVGFVLMLFAETVYTLRKRLPRFTLGSMSIWLQLHVFAGLVGPYLVLLHSAGKFNGLAGVVTLLTILMVVSGFVGRYIYTAAPRTLEGAEVGVAELQGQIAEADRQLQALGVQLGGVLALEPPRGWRLVLGRHVLRWRHRRRLRRAIQALKLQDHAVAVRLQQLLTERYRLLLDIHGLAVTRRLLALWHLFHIPLGAVLFTLALVHIGAALYYATLMR